MATKVFFLNSTLADYGEEEFNYIQKFLLQQGILNTQGADYNDFADLKVTQNGAGNMSVNVAVGVAVLNTVRSGVTFKIFVSNQAIANLVVANNATGSNRIDPVILKISRTTEPNALMNNVATLQVLTGTGVSAMTDNAIQSAIGADYDFIRLANLTVTNGDTQILTADIADARVRCYSTDVSVPNPTIIKFRQLASDPTTPAEGEMWYNTTANILRYYDGASTINIQASTYTGGNGIDVTAGVVSVKLEANSGMEFNAGALRLKDFKKSLQAGEAIDGSTTPIPILVSDAGAPGTSKILVNTSATSQDTYGVNWYAQTFDTKALLTVIKSVKIYIQKVGSPTGNCTVSIRATSAGLPTGSDLATINVATSGITSGWVEFVLPTPLVVSANTVYALIMNVTAGNASNYITWYRSTSGVYADGSYISSANSGSSWTANTTYDFAIDILGGITVSAGKIRKSLATEALLAVVDGFIKTNVALDAYGEVIMTPIISGFTGLTIGKNYYLADNGTLSVTPGTVNVLVGRSISATELRRL